MAYGHCARCRAANCEDDRLRRSRVPDGAMLLPRGRKDGSRTDVLGSTLAPPRAWPEFRPSLDSADPQGPIGPTVAGPSSLRRKTRRCRAPPETFSTLRPSRLHKRGRAVCDLRAADSRNVSRAPRSARLPPATRRSLLSETNFFPSQLRGRGRHDSQVNVRSARQRDTPVCHCTFAIQIRGLLKGADGGVVIEAVNESQALIEITLRFWRTGCNFARIGAEAIVKRFLRCAQIEAGQCQRQPDDHVDELCRCLHRCSPAHAKLVAALSAETANRLDNCSAIAGAYRPRIFVLSIIPDHANHCDEH